MTFDDAIKTDTTTMIEIEVRLSFSRELVDLQVKSPSAIFFSLGELVMTKKLTTIKATAEMMRPAILGVIRLAFPSLVNAS